jgi:hypothetical protein
MLLCRTRLYRLAEVLRRAECHFLAGLDLDCFPCSGVAFHAGRALAHLEGAKPREKIL